MFKYRVESKADASTVFNALISVDEGDEGIEDTQPAPAPIPRPHSMLKRSSALKVLFNCLTVETILLLLTYTYARL